jgi:hypothetical protein
MLQEGVDESRLIDLDTRRLDDLRVHVRKHNAVNISTSWVAAANLQANSTMRSAAGSRLNTNKAWLKQFKNSSTKSF